jgi:hypothetical protein
VLVGRGGGGPPRGGARDATLAAGLAEQAVYAIAARDGRAQGQVSFADDVDGALSEAFGPPVPEARGWRQLPWTAGRRSPFVARWLPVAVRAGVGAITLAATIGFVGTVAGVLLAWPP